MKQFAEQAVDPVKEMHDSPPQIVSTKPVVQQLEATLAEVDNKGWIQSPRE